MMRLLSAGAVVLAIAATAGCSGEATSAEDGARGLAPDAVAGRYGYDPSATNLTPVYALVPEYHDPRDGYARDLLAQQCLQGMVDYTPVRLGEQGDFFDGRTGQPVFNEAIAQRWGYSADRLNPPSDSAVPSGVTITDEIQAAMIECGEAADARLGQPPERLPTEIESAGWQAVETSETVSAAADRWQVCMKPAGVSDLPEKPGPPQSLLSATSVTDADGNLVPDGSAGPSAREIEVAVLDANCRVDSGYDDAVFEARVQAELAAIGQNLEDFDAIRDEYKSYAGGVDEVIVELG